MSSTTGEPDSLALGDRVRKPRPHAGRAPKESTRPALPPEIVAVLRRNAGETLARHQPLPDGRCSFCSATWQHTNTMFPCPPARIAHEFLRLTHR